MKEVFDVKGMHCSACSAAVEKAAKKVNGVKSASVNLMTNSMICEYDNPETGKQICDSVKKAGYKAKIRKSDQTEKEDLKSEDFDEFRAVKKRLWISVGILIPLMIIAMGHMYPHGFFLHHFAMKAEYAGIFALVQLLLTIPVLFINREFFTRGFKAVIAKSPNMDTLVALGASASVLYGIYEIIMIVIGLGQGYAQSNPELITRYSHNLYFEGAAMILTLVTVGKTLEQKAKGKTNQALKKLVALKPSKVRIIVDDEEKEIDTKDLKAGDVMVVRPGESVCADGVIVKGYSSFDQSALTGESVPVDKYEGDTVMSASINVDGLVYVKAEKVGDETTLSKIISLVENAGATKSKSSRLADKVSGIFVPVVSGIAVITFIIWLIAGKEFQFALNMGVSVLVISCPCALGLATPVAVSAAVGKSASEGVLVKSAEVMENLSTADTVVFDKTGTLTIGEPKVTDVICKIDKTEFLKIASSLESGSEHPLSKAVTSEYTGEKYELADFKAEFGKGVTGYVDGKFFMVGNSKLMSEKGIDFSEYEEKANEFAMSGKTPLYFADENEVVGIIAVSDVLKDESKNTIENLKNGNHKVMMITGDNEIVANAIKNEVGIDDVISNILPEDKANEISKLKENGNKVVMVGDGINDSPALMTADVGIAMGSGSDIAIESADVIILNNNISKVHDTIKFSKRVVLNIKENLFWAFFYNVIGIPVAAGVLFPAFGIMLNPMIASACMSVSSIFVVLNALRLYRK